MGVTFGSSRNDLASSLKATKMALTSTIPRGRTSSTWSVAKRFLSRRDRARCTPREKLKAPATHKAASDTQLNYAINSVMTKEPISVAPSDGILDAAKKMIERGLAGLPVVENGEFVGMVSDIDVMTSELMPGVRGRIDDMDSIFPSPDVDWSSFRSLKKQLKKISGQSIADLMTPASDVRAVGPDTTVDATANVLIRHRLRRVPVVEDGKLLGIVTRGDILRSGIKRIVETSEQGGGKGT
eukprot:CAMPEP_0185265804 /NCGR_PEP_ID=MMETSP1359-20130426/28861_1 /TAXON_ID=552665 /ORGANISM="Bigelowiella longifila, Strain CCMP242" /LENGTH=240 /DNA_ID=CAMNT_0027855287 /DNA_START=11 /DNA_END=733 /DNA_ORIENTATION=+